MNPNRSLSVGRVIPLIIGLAALVDVGSRCLPLAWFTFRLEEASKRYPVSSGPYTPSFHYAKARAYGDIANIANLPSYRTFRREEFTAGRDGFRMTGGPQEPGGARPDIVLFGDSFAGGVSLSDNDTLPAQFYRVSGRRMFDAGGVKVDWGRVRGVIDYLGLTKGWVVLAWVERNDLPTYVDMDERPGRVKTAWDRLSHSVEKVWRGFWEACPVQILAQRQVRRIQNDRVLPNLLAPNALRDTLSDGRPIIFLGSDVANLGNPAPVNIDGMREFQDRLERRGLHLLVLLIPDKYHVYHRLLAHPPNEPAGPSRMSRYETVLRQSGIAVLNMETPLIAAARDALPQGRLIYWPDDTHWNAEGVHVTAKALAAAFAAKKR